MLDLLAECRAALGPPPRILSDEQVRQLRWIYVPFPVGIFPIDSLMRIYFHQKRLRERGDVVWGHIVQANDFIYGPGLLNEPQAATVLYGGPELNDVSVLAEAAQRIGALKGTRQTDPELKAAVEFTHESSRKYARPVPASLADGHTIYCSDFLILRNHLPGGTGQSILKKPFFPLLVNPSETKAVMMLPAAFWPGRLLEIWNA